MTVADTSTWPPIANKSFCNPKATLAQSSQSETCNSKSLIGANAWPSVSVSPTPMGCTASSVPCTTDTAPCNPRAAAKLSSERLSPSSTERSANTANAGNQHASTASVSSNATSVSRMCHRGREWGVETRCVGMPGPSNGEIGKYPSDLINLLTRWIGLHGAHQIFYNLDI